MKNKLKKTSEHDLDSFKKWEANLKEEIDFWDNWFRIKGAEPMGIFADNNNFCFKNHLKRIKLSRDLKDLTEISVNTNPEKSWIVVSMRKRAGI